MATPSLTTASLCLQILLAAAWKFSYLDDNETDRPSDEEAWSKIDHSRRVVEVLKTKYPSLQSALGEATLRFSLCRDYGKGAYAVAEVKGDKLVWISV